MIEVIILVVVGAAFLAWDQRSAPSESPDRRMVGVGAVLAIVGAVSSLMLWWLYVPVVVLLGGLGLIVHGRHRSVAVS